MRKILLIGLLVLLLAPTLAIPTLQLDKSNVLFDNIAATIKAIFTFDNDVYFNGDVFIKGATLNMTNVNSSEYWGTLHTPADIPGSGYWYNQTIGAINYCSANYVPYTGATTNLDLGNKNITTTGAGQFAYIDKLALTTQPDNPPNDTLRLYVENIKNFTLYKYLDSTGMKRELVRDSMILVKNVRGTTIPAYRFVYATGSEEQIPTVDLAKADSLSTMPAIGVTIEAITNGSYGRVMQVGLVENVNTNAYVEGNILYVSDITAGLGKATPPLTPNLTQEMGTILVKNITYGKVQIIARGLTGNEFGTINNFAVIGNVSTPMLKISDWIMDNGGTGFRFYPSGGTAKVNINSSRVQIGQPGTRENLDVYGNIETFDPAGGGGNLIIQGNATMNNYYGEMKNWTEGGYTATPAAVAVYENATGLKAGINNGFVFATRAKASGGDYLQAQFAGVYKVTGKLTVQITTGGLYGFGIVVNGANPETTGDCYSRKTGNGNWDTIPIDCFYRLNAGDNLTLVYDDEANPVKALLIEKIEVNVLRIGN